MSSILLAPPPPPTPPPPPAAVVIRKPVAHLMDAGKLVTPKAIPKDLKVIKEEPEPDMGAGMVGGVPGGVAGGSAGGVLGGVIGGAGTAPPPPPRTMNPPIASPRISSKLSSSASSGLRKRRRRSPMTSATSMPRPKATASTSRRCVPWCACASRTLTSARNRKPFWRST